MENPESFYLTIMQAKRSQGPPSSASSRGGAGDSFTTGSSGVSPRTEEEDDDMAANCLILLARGRHAPPEATAAAPGGAYECKTCGKSFPSFQALGGHRASHKRPKPLGMEIADRKRSPPHTAASPPHTAASPPITESKVCRGEPNKGKIHGCSICGSEFGSGQALGGHMRRHRPTPPTTTAFDVEGEKSRNVPGFDLNVRAAPEDNRFRRLPAAAALVDCHY